MTADSARVITPDSSTAATAMPIVRCEGLVQIYAMAGQQVTALRGVDLSAAQGGTVASLGPSGAGTSTLRWLPAGPLPTTAGLVSH